MFSLHMGDINANSACILVPCIFEELVIWYKEKLDGYVVTIGKGLSYAHAINVLYTARI